MPFQKLAKQITVEVGKHKSKMTFRPLGSESLQKLFSHVNIKDLNATKPSLVSGVMVDHIVSMEGIDCPITEEFLLNDISLLDFYNCLTEMVKAATVTEDQSKNSDSPSDSQSSAAEKVTETAE